MSKIAPSARLREEIAAFLDQAEGSESGASALSRLVQLATARLGQEALEQEQTDCIGRERYVREAGRGKRNGYVPGQLATADGRVAVHVPQVREAGQPYRSALFPGGCASSAGPLISANGASWRSGGARRPCRASSPRRVV